MTQDRQPRAGETWHHKTQAHNRYVYEIDAEAGEVRVSGTGSFDQDPVTMKIADFVAQYRPPSWTLEEMQRYTYLSSDPTRTDAEDYEMLKLKEKLTAGGADLGLPPVSRHAE